MAAFKDASVVVSELVRAANRIHKVSATERRRLVDDGIKLIRELLLAAGARPVLASEKENFQSLTIAASHVDIPSDEEVRLRLLEIAEMVRMLKIRLETTQKSST